MLGCAGESSKGSFFSVWSGSKRLGSTLGRLHSASKRRNYMTKRMEAVLAAARQEAALPRESLVDGLQKFITGAIDDIRNQDYSHAVRWLEVLKETLDVSRGVFDHRGEAALQRAIRHMELTKKLYETELALWALLEDEEMQSLIVQRGHEIEEIEEFLSQAVSISIGNLDPAMA
jgi:hypothetical protein